MISCMELIWSLCLDKLENANDFINVRQQVVSQKPRTSNVVMIEEMGVALGIPYQYRYRLEHEGLSIGKGQV